MHANYHFEWRKKLEEKINEIEPDNLDILMAQDKKLDDLGTEIKKYTETLEKMKEYYWGH